MIAYFILVHRYPEQFKRLFQSIYDPKNTYLIHTDKKSDTGLYKQIKKFLADFPNAYLLKSQNVVWGGYSMVDAELKGMKKLLKLSAKWDFFINLSGQDFPLKPQSFIKNFLKKNQGKDFMLVSDQIKMRPITLNRIDNYFVETDNGFLGKPIKRSYLTDVKPYIGGQWKILSRECCEFICSSSEVNKFKDYYRNTLIPDESFFQTVLMNTNYSKRIINDDKRAIIWIPDVALTLPLSTHAKSDTQSLVDSGEIKLRPKIFTTEDLSFLLSSDALFARKFDETVDSKILDILESKIKALSFGFAKKQVLESEVITIPLQSTLTLPIDSPYIN